MSKKKDVAEVVSAPAEVSATPAEEPVKVAPEPEEKPVDTEDAFVEESLGVEPATTEEPEEATPEPETPTVAPVEKKEEVAEPVEEPEKEQPEVPAEPKVSRLDKRLAEKYSENLVLKGSNVPSAGAIMAELAEMSVDEKKNALRNLLDENRNIRGQQPEPLSHEDEEAIIEAEVERREKETQKAIREREFQKDLVATLEKYPELDKRTAKYNPTIEKAVIPMVENGMFASEAYAIVQEAIKNATENERKNKEVESQKSMSGSVIAPPVSEPINKSAETEEDKFLADAGVL